jgi:hypothetical protein
MVSDVFGEEQGALFELPPLPASEPTYVSWKDVPDATVVEVFDVWREVHSKSRAVLSPERRRAICKAVASHGRAMTLDAIHGCSLSPWHMGQNPSGKRYNDINLILRNAEKIEGFAELFGEVGSGGGFLD